MSAGPVSTTAVHPGTAAHGHGHAHKHDGLRPEDWPHDRFMGRATALKIGMWVFLLSDAFSFAGLLIAYGILRAGATQWIPPGEPALGINFTAGLTFLLICSSVTMVLAVASCRERNRGRTILFLALTMLGGILFLAGQYHEYFGIWESGLTRRGLIFGHSHRATTFYLITSFHGLHVFSGVTVLGITLIRAVLGRFDGGRYDAVESVGLFWHFVDLVWILVFTFVYLIPPSATPGT